MNENGPTVSAIICCYNAAPFLAETIRSLLGQTRPPEEIIVVDDGSADDSARIAEGFGPPVRVLRQASNQGPSAARNVGTRAARGEYLLFIDADDLLHPTALSRLAAAAARAPGAVAVMGCAWFHEDPAAPFAVRLFELDDFFPEIIRGNFGPQHTRLVPRDATLRAGGFPEHMRIYEDWHYWCRVALLGTPLVPVPFVGAYYRRHPASTLARTPEPAVIAGHLEVMRVLCEAFLRRDDLLQKHGEALFWSAWTALHRARQTGVGWRNLDWLARSVREVARRGPADLRRSRFGRAVRLLGTRWAETLRGLLVRERAPRGAVAAT